MNKTYTCICLMALLSALPVTAWFEQIPIKDNMTIEQKAIEIDAYISYSPLGHGIKYKFSRAVHDWYHTWLYRAGDCSDIAILKARVYEEHNISYRLVHGYADGKYHDWIEHQNESGEYNTFEGYYFENLTIAGYGELW